MFKKKCIFYLLGLLCFSCVAQYSWPAIQAQVYPLTPEMRLTNHERSLLLGEGIQQTGVFFAIHPNTYSEKTQSMLIEDAAKKGWQLSSVMRSGTNYNLTFMQSDRVLDIRLSNTAEGVNAIYSIVPNQQKGGNSNPVSLSGN